MTGGHHPWCRRAVLAALVAATGLQGCGYRLGGRVLSEDIRTIGIRMFANRTTQPFVEGVLTQAVGEAFSTDGRLRVVAPELADVVLDGDVVGYRVDSVAFDSRTNVQQYRLFVTVDVRVRDTRHGGLLFEERGIRDRADFGVAGTVAQTIGAEGVALRVAAVEIARTVVSVTLQRY